MSETRLKPRAVAAISPGPWNSYHSEEYLSGAILIEDAEGEIIGWATDAVGHTNEPALPERRHPDQIASNALVMAFGWDMLQVVRLLAQAAPLTIARLQRLGAAPHPELLEASAYATNILRSLGERR